LSELFHFVVNRAVIESGVAEAAAFFSSSSRAAFGGWDSYSSAPSFMGINFNWTITGIAEWFVWRCESGIGMFLGCPKVDIRKNLSDLVIESGIDLESPNLSFEALDRLLLSEFVSVESQDAQLRFEASFNWTKAGHPRHFEGRDYQPPTLEESIQPVDRKIVESYLNKFLEYEQQAEGVIHRLSRVMRPFDPPLDPSVVKTIKMVVVKFCCALDNLRSSHVHLCWEDIRKPELVDPVARNRGMLFKLSMEDVQNCVAEILEPIQPPKKKKEHCVEMEAEFQQLFRRLGVDPTVLLKHVDPHHPGRSR
jgi:hypothetical protein